MSAGVWCMYAWNVCMKANSDVWKHIKVLSAQRGKTQYNFQVQTFSSYPATPCANTHGIMRYHLIFFKSSEKTKLLCTDVHTQRINGELLTETLHSCLLLARYHQGGKAVLEHTKFKLPIPKALTSKCRRALNSFCKLLPQQVCKGFTTFQWGKDLLLGLTPNFEHAATSAQSSLSGEIEDTATQSSADNSSYLWSLSCLDRQETAIIAVCTAEVLSTYFWQLGGMNFITSLCSERKEEKKNLFVLDIFIVVKLSTAKYM